jgi:hypothetical protein
MAKSKPTKKNPGGRPTDYKKTFCKLAFRYALLGATDEDLASFFEVSTVTIASWKHKHPEFLKALTRGKTEVDAKVAESFYKR